MFKILAVDDDILNLELIKAIFEEEKDIKVLFAKNGKEALNILEKEDIDLILLDLAMPVLNGFDLLKIIRKEKKLETLPIIVITANSDEKLKCLKLGANDFLSKPIEPTELKLRVRNYLKLREYEKRLKNINKYLEEEVQKRTYALKEALKRLEEALKFAKETELAISRILGKAAEFRDIETGNHIIRMSKYCEIIARNYGLSKKEQELILYASPLHDVGKIGIPDEILLKPGRLTEEEFEIIKKHTIIGAKILEGFERYPIVKYGKIIALEHHERWDGKGYPYGKRGEEIHIFSRIAAIADVFDALTSPRIYKPPFPLEKAINIIKEEKGKAFDPTLVDVFLDSLDEIKEVKKKYEDKNLDFKDNIIYQYLFSKGKFKNVLLENLNLKNKDKTTQES